MPYSSPSFQRPRDVTVRAQNEKGETVHLQLGGEDEEAAWISRIFQHEYDHLQVGMQGGRDVVQEGGICQG